LKSHVSEDGKVVMKSLEEEQAKEPFVLHAFGNANHVPTKDFKYICMKIIKACGGLPLSLKVLSSFLCNIKKLEIWEGALRKLKNEQKGCTKVCKLDTSPVINRDVCPFDVTMPICNPCGQCCSIY